MMLLCHAADIFAISLAALLPPPDIAAAMPFRCRFAYC